MAKTGVFKSDPMVMTKAMELKKELQKLVRNIVDDEDYRTELIDQARETLFALKGLKVKRRSSSLKLRETVLCPEEFKCPLSKELMRDPVVLATGQVSVSSKGILSFTLFGSQENAKNKQIFVCVCVGFSALGELGNVVITCIFFTLI